MLNSQVKIAHIHYTHDLTIKNCKVNNFKLDSHKLQYTERE